MTDFQEILPGFPVAILKTIMVPASVGSLDYMGEEAEIVSQCEEGILMNPGFAVGIKIRKNPPVLSQ